MIIFLTKSVIDMVRLFFLPPNLPTTAFSPSGTYKLPDKERKPTREEFSDVHGWIYSHTHVYMCGCANIRE